jgi:hypothetical protein
VADVQRHRKPGSQATGQQGAISQITPSGQVTTCTDPDTAQINVDLTVIGPDKNGSSTDGKGVVLE